MDKNGDTVMVNNGKDDYSEKINFSLRKVTPPVIDQMTTTCCMKLVLADLIMMVLVLCGVIDPSMRVSAQPMIDANIWSEHEYERFVSGLGLESTSTYPLVLIPRNNNDWDESFYAIRKHVRYSLDDIGVYHDQEEMKFQLYENFKKGGKRFPVLAVMYMGWFEHADYAKKAANGDAYDSSRHPKHPSKGPRVTHALLITGLVTNKDEFICEVRSSYGDEWGDGGFSRVLMKEFDTIYIPRYERPYLPVYISLPMGIINKNSQLSDPGSLQEHLRMLRAISVDGVRVHCWWGIVERNVPYEYVWDGYEDLFKIAHELGLHIQVVLAFHEYIGTGNDELHIPLPKWLRKISKDLNNDIFFKNQRGRRNSDYLSWGIDKEKVIGERTGLEVYEDFMRSFSIKFNKYLDNNDINMIEIGVGPFGEPRYPLSPFSSDSGQIGEFMCYDTYLKQSLKKVAAAQDFCEFDEPPDTGGFYNSHPNDTIFFCDRGPFKENKELFFLNWYSQQLFHHIDNVFGRARFVFDKTDLYVRIPQIYSRYKTESRASELTAGFHSTQHKDTYEELTDILQRYDIRLNHTLDSSAAALGDGDTFAARIMTKAREKDVEIACDLVCASKEELKLLMDNAKYGDYKSVTCSLLIEPKQYSDLDWFVRQMHGEIIA